MAFRKLILSVIVLGIGYLSSARDAGATDAGGTQSCVNPPLEIAKLGETANGAPTITVTISGRSYPFIFWSGGVSTVSARVVAALHLKVRNIPHEISWTIGNKSSRLEADVPNLMIGKIQMAQDTMVVMPDDNNQSTVGGTLGLSLIKRSGLDLEFDLAQHTAKLFAEVPCEGGGVYWTEPYAEVGFVWDELGPSFDALLDGHHLTAGLDPSLDKSYIGIADVVSWLHIDRDDPKLVRLPGPDSVPDNYRYPFQTLVLRGLAISHPNIEIFPQTSSLDCISPSCHSEAPLQLGRAEIRRLRLYFAFTYDELFFVPSDASEIVVPPASAPEPVDPATDN